jgi:hypothetical protein
MAARKRTRDLLGTSKPKFPSPANEVRVTRLTPGKVFKDGERLRGRRRALLERSDCGLMIIAIDRFGVIGLWVDPYRCEQDKCVTLTNFNESCRGIFGDSMGNPGLSGSPREFAMTIVGNRRLVDE